MIQINMEGQKNIRDLGNTVTSDGRRIRRGKLIRSGRLSELTERDESFLLGSCRVRTVVDLRTVRECTERPDPQWPIVEHVRIPLLSDDQMGLSIFRSGRAAQEKVSVLDTLVNMTSGPAYTPKQYLTDIYRSFIKTKQAQNATRRFFQTVFSRKDGALLYHCNGGKDRTGIITVFLLTMLNVPWDAIAADYMETNVIVRPWLEQRLENLSGKYRNEQTKAVLRMMYLADEECLQAAYDEMCELGGTPEGYLKQVIGISDFAIEEFRNRMLM